MCSAISQRQPISKRKKLDNMKDSMLNPLDSTLNLDFYHLYFNRWVPLTIILPFVLFLSYTNLLQMLETAKHIIINIILVFSICNMYPQIYYCQGSLFFCGFLLSLLMLSFSLRDFSISCIVYWHSYFVWKYLYFNFIFEQYFCLDKFWTGSIVFSIPTYVSLYLASIATV